MIKSKVIPQPFFLLPFFFFLIQNNSQGNLHTLLFSDRLLTTGEQSSWNKTRSELNLCPEL